jgi:hypothetical protein
LYSNLAKLCNALDIQRNIKQLMTNYLTVEITKPQS